MKSLDGYTVIGPLCYQGKPDCEDARCTRAGFMLRDDGGVDLGRCVGYHCSYCDEPCGPQGHRCPASEAILGEARRIAAAGLSVAEPAEDDTA